MRANRRLKTESLQSESGQTLINAMIAIALIGMLALFSSSAVNYITNALRRNGKESRLTSLDTDIANLLAIPQECTCNFANGAEYASGSASFANPNSTLALKSLKFFDDPPTCTNSKADSVITVGKVHKASGLTIKGIQIGPFHPLGSSGTYLADLTVTADTLQQPLQTKVLIAATDSGGMHNINFCGFHLGSTPIKVAPDDSKVSGFYRYSQYSLNFACPALPLSTSVNPHPLQTEPYAITRVQYFWPRQDGDFLTDYETGRTAGKVMAPVSFSAFYGTSVCYEVDGEGDAIRVIVPSYTDAGSTNSANCETIKSDFLAGAAITNIGFSVIDNCRSRFF